MMYRTIFAPHPIPIQDKYLMVTINEVASDQMNFWQLARHYGVEEDFEKLHDRAISWYNDNNVSAINRLIKSPGTVLACKIAAFKNHIKHQGNYATPIGTPEEFEAALQTPLTLWRGGQGDFDPLFKMNRSWVSFTGKKQRAYTFSKYDGSYAMNTFKLPENERFWIIEITVPLDGILLYLSGGGDDEFVVPKSYLKTAKIVATHNSPDMSPQEKIPPSV